MGDGSSTRDQAGARETWDEQRIEGLGSALVAAADGAHIGLSVVRMDPPHPRVVFINDVGVQVLGHPREIILSQPATSFLAPEERQAHGPRVDERARGQSTNPRSFETTVATADGRRVPIEVSVAQVDLGGRPVLVTFFRDIQGRRDALEALKRSEERFRKLIELAPDAVWINDGQHLVFVNPATIKMLAYDRAEEVVALHPRDIIHPDDRKAMRERTEQMFETGEALPPRDYRVRRRDGTWAVAEVRSMPLEWEGQKAILGIARDVTTRREMEAQLVRSDRLAALGTLLAGIAHEINNPLAYVTLGVERARGLLESARTRPDDLRRLTEVLEDVRHGVDRVSAVVKQLRASSRPEAEERGLVDLRRVLESAMKVVGNEIRHRARLTVELGNVPAIQGSAQRLEQVFLNLLVNALQALPEGRADNEIRLSMGLAGTTEVAVEVRDNGVGMPADVLPRIFDPFFTTKPVGMGMGLGLSICHSIVASHGGTITVDSAPAVGTTFRVTLPVRRSPAGEERRMTPARSPVVAVTPGRRRRVLVVDDEPSLGEMIRRMLEPECEVEAVLDAREALHRIGRGSDRFDVVLCDLMMPEMTGMDLFATVAKQHPGVEERFVFMTGGAFTPGAAHFLAQVPNPRIEKPFGFDVLRGLLARAWEE
jgi:PAS domain S-box-containing protein